MTSIVVIDTETTQNNKGDSAVGKFRASPHHGDNRIVYLGWKFLEGRYVNTKNPIVFGLDDETAGVDVLVGHNIKFDLHYMNKIEDIKAYIKRGGQIWDTMVAEYVLSGQSSNAKEKGTLSLDGLAKKYGFELKDNKIKEYFEAGIGSEDIPEEEIKPYLQQDVQVTEAVFKRQVEEAIGAGMMPLILNMMEAVLATWMMEHNGTKVDQVGMYNYERILSNEIINYTSEIINLAGKIAHLPTPIAFNPNSDQQLSAVLFGGVLKYKEEEYVHGDDGQPVVYKSGKKKGQVKTKKVDKEFTCKAQLHNPAFYGSTTTARGWSVTDAVLDKIVSTASHPGVRLICIKVRAMRKLKKEVGTYLRGILDRTWPDGKIHPEYNMTTTKTGRLSCSNPNLQNIKSR